MVTGQYHNTLDEKGRLLVPARIRNEIPVGAFVITRGVDQCLWMFPPEEWDRIAGQIMGVSSPFKAKARLMQRRIIAPAQETALDKAGRIALTPSLREIAGLTKEALILGMGTYLEIWDPRIYEEYLAASEEEFLEAAEDLGDLLTPGREM